MSEVRVNKLSPRSGTTVTLGDSGDTITIPSGVTFDASSGGLAGTLTTAAQPNITSVGTLTSFASTGIDDNATSTAVTINSSGRLLVGTTTTTPATTTGVRLYEDGRGFFTADGTYVGYFNRLTSDGELIQLRKDGTTVGSIGSRSGVVTNFILDPRTATNGGAGIGATGATALPAILPTDESTVADNNTDLGSSGTRWKDIYLSGGAFIGGTGSANKLDDYEEGTWTPTIVQGYNTVSYAIQGGTYTKIGRNVFFTLRVELTGSTANTSGIKISIPFTAASSPSGSFTGGGNFAYVNVNIINSLTTNPPTIYAPQNNSFIALYKTDGNTFNGNDLNSPSNPDFYIFGNYITD